MNTIKGISATNIGCGKVENVVDSTLTTKEQMHIDELLKTYPDGYIIFKPLLGFGKATIFVDSNCNFIKDITDYDKRFK